MVKLIEDNKLDYQLAAAGDHQLMPAERAIQTTKNCFIAVPSGIDPAFLTPA